MRGQLKDCSLMTLYDYWSFSSHSLFPVNSRFFSSALHSDDSFSQVSDEKLLRRYEHSIQSISQVLYHQSAFQVKQILSNAIFFLKCQKLYAVHAVNSKRLYAKMLFDQESQCEKNIIRQEIPCLNAQKVHYQDNKTPDIQLL